MIRNGDLGTNMKFYGSMVFWMIWWVMIYAGPASEHEALRTN
jgi:hypothetical protein